MTRRRRWHAKAKARNQAELRRESLVENRNGLIIKTDVFEANGTAERDAALVMLEQIPGTRPVTVGRRQGSGPAI